MIRIVYRDEHCVAVDKPSGVAVHRGWANDDDPLLQQVRDTVGPVLGEGVDGLDSERRALAAFLRFAREHRDIYRIIDESEFVDPTAYREHYETTASRIAARLRSAREKGEIDSGFSDKDVDVLAWGMMGANVFIGLRFAVWDDADSEQVAAIMSRVWRQGFGA